MKNSYYLSNIFYDSNFTTVVYFYQLDHTIKTSPTYQNSFRTPCAQLLYASCQGNYAIIRGVFILRTQFE